MEDILDSIPACREPRRTKDRHLYHGSNGERIRMDASGNGASSSGPRPPGPPLAIQWKSPVESHIANGCHGCAGGVVAEILKDNRVHEYLTRHENFNWGCSAPMPSPLPPPIVVLPGHSAAPSVRFQGKQLLPIFPAYTDSVPRVHGSHQLRRRSLFVGDALMQRVWGEGRERQGWCGENSCRGISHTHTHTPPLLT